MTAEDFHCPSCEETIRSTGGGESLFETDSDMNKVVPHNLSVFSEHSVTDDNHLGYLYYCPNEDCRVWRLLPGDDE